MGANWGVLGSSEQGTSWMTRAKANSGKSVTCRQCASCRQCLIGVTETSADIGQGFLGILYSEIIAGHLNLKQTSAGCF